MDVPSQLREFPLVWAVATDKVSDICSFCLKKSTKLLRCSKCSFLRYCSTSCQSSDWACHKLECRRVAALRETNTSGVYQDALDDDVRLIFRLFEAMKKPEMLAKESEGRNLGDLITHAARIESDLDSSEEFRNFYMHKFAPFFSAAKDSKTVPPPKVILSTYGMVKVNSFQITNEELHAIGVGLYLSLCRLDHSCQPNGRIIFRGKEALVVPVEKSGWKESEVSMVDGQSVVHYELIQHSYIDNLDTLENRRRILLRDYFFHCDCRGCQNSQRNAMMSSMFCSETLGCGGCMKAPVETTEVMAYNCSECGKKISEVETVKMVLGTVNAGLQNLERMTKLSHPQVASELAGKLLCLTEGVMGRWNIDKMKITRTAYELSVKLGQWENAIKYGTEVLEVYRFYLAPADPKLLTFLKKLAICCRNGKDLAKSKELIQPYKEKYGTLWGADSEAFREVEFMLTST